MAERGTRVRAGGRDDDVYVRRRGRGNDRRPNRGGRDRGGASWLPWVLGLLALLLIGLLIWALVANSDDSDTTATGDTGTEQELDGGSTGTGDTGTAGEGTPGTIVAGSEDVLAAATAGDLGSFAGQQVTGTAVPVESVIADEAFWVGPSADERVLVYITDAGAESGVDVDAGDTVTFSGTLQPVEDGFTEQAGIDETEGATDLTEQSYYIAAEQVQEAAA